MLEDKPLHVKVAEALGVKSLAASWGYSGPPADGKWTHERSRLFATEAEAREALYARGIGGHEPEPTLCFWKDGWGPIMVDEYDTDWSATGPLIEKYAINLQVEWYDGYHWRAYTYPQGLSEIQADGDTPLIAVCNLILALKEAGKL